MEEENLKEILKIILDSIRNEEFIWRLEGSANLRIQGVDVSINDLDITTNQEGIEIFRRVLKDFIVEDFFSEKVRGQSLICKIEGFEVEINCYGDRDKNYFEEIEIIEWQGLTIPILPLKYALEFYRSIGREEKVKLIMNYLTANK